MKPFLSLLLSLSSVSAFAGNGKSFIVCTGLDRQERLVEVQIHTQHRNATDETSKVSLRIAGRAESYSRTRFVANDSVKEILRGPIPSDKAELVVTIQRHENIAAELRIPKESGQNHPRVGEVVSANLKVTRYWEQRGAHKQTEVKMECLFSPPMEPSSN